MRKQDEDYVSGSARDWKNERDHLQSKILDLEEAAEEQALEKSKLRWELAKVKSQLAVARQHLKAATSSLTATPPTSLLGSAS